MRRVKWSLAALKKVIGRSFRRTERVKHAFEAVNDIFIKPFIAIEAQVNSAMKMFVPFKEIAFSCLVLPCRRDTTTLVDRNQLCPSLAWVATRSKVEKSLY